MFLKVDDRKFAFARLTTDEYVEYLHHPQHVVPVANQWLEEHTSDGVAAPTPGLDPYRPRAARRAHS